MPFSQSWANDTQAGNADDSAPNEAQLPIPRFVSLKVDEVNMRTGPGERYPIEWVIRRKMLPVEVIAEFDLWRRVRDHKGTEGWVHKSMLSGKRTALVNNTSQLLRQTPDATAKPIAKLETGAIGEIKKCVAGNTWCRVKFNKRFEGWIERSAVFGVYDNEVVD